MRNPLDVQMILFGDDVRMGLLQEMGFRKEPHPEGVGSSLYRREGVLLHSMGLWVEGVYYLRLREAFYRVEAPLAPLTGAPAEARVPLAEGLEALRPFACWYEAQDGRPGPGPRQRALRELIRQAQRALEAWRVWVGRSPRVPT
ncbi:hypothetical protein [Thermus sp.]|uniref:hypothetical protein n=1 Tax=Thermus sp. TaxID=275 RepID=UPI00307D2DA5